MAIYHFHAQMISRKQGRSSVATSAYRSGQCLTDARTGKVHDFSKKEDILESTILLPKGAPEAFLDRETLWNTVEKVEKRKDSQLAREINIALPRELNEAQNWQLALDYVQKEFVSKGMIADVAFHRGHGGEGEEQPHIHVMLTTREVGPQGFGQKERTWNSKALLVDWRERWAELHNERVAELGFEVRIHAGTLEAQGINLEAHHYRNGMVDKRTGETFAEYLERAERNGERLLDDPTIALTALSAQQSTFSRHDLARFVNRNSRDAEQFQQVYAAIMASPALVQLGRNAGDIDRFTTRELLAIEKEMLVMAQEKAESRHFEAKAKTVDRVIEKNSSLSTEQRAALRHITQGTDLPAVVGFAGTGKSYMLGAAREVWETEGYRVQGMALSGIAADSLQSGANIASNTIANRLLIWKNEREKLSNRDILVVDEAGMIGSRQMHAILSYAEKGGAKVVLVGDPEQLQAIDAGASFRAIIERTGFAQMSEIRRQKEEWQKEATIHFGLKQAAVGLQAYERHDNIHQYDTKSAAIAGMIETWDENRCLNPDKTQIILAFTREEVKQLNETARAIRHKARELGQDRIFNTENGERALAQGDRIYFLANENKHLHVKNGNLGVITKIEGAQLTVKLDALNGVHREVSFNLSDYKDIDHGYAATVYKSQGITVDRTSMLASRYYDSHATYVGMTRHRDSADIYYSQDEFKDFNALTWSLSREKDKDVTQDYAQHPHINVANAPIVSASLQEKEAKTEVQSLVSQLKEYLVDENKEERLKSAEARLRDRQKSRETKAQHFYEESEAKLMALFKENFYKSKRDKGFKIDSHDDTLKRKADSKDEDKPKSAKERFQRRLHDIAIQKDMERIADKTGLDLSMDLQEGTFGIYHGTYEVAGRAFGLLETKNGEGKLIPAQQLESREKGESMFLAKVMKQNGREEIRGVQPKQLLEKIKTLQKQQEQDLGLSY